MFLVVGLMAGMVGVGEMWCWFVIRPGVILRLFG